MVTAPEIVGAINARHGTSLKLAERYRGGLQGAYRVTDESEKNWVLKFSSGTEFRSATAAAFTARLREIGYPAPRYLLFGRIGETGYSVQEELSGTPIRIQRAETLEQLFRFNDLQRDAGNGESSEPERLVRSVTTGLNEFCRTEVMRSYSAETAEMLSRLQTLVTRYAPALPRKRDIVHFDFSHVNILAEGDCVTGVIDWEGATVGDCAFDLATLLFYSYANPQFREPIWARLLERTSRQAASIYLAHMVVRQLDFSLREQSGWLREYFLDIVRAITRDIGRL